MGIGGVESSLRSSTWALWGLLVTRNPISLGPKWLTDSLVVAVSAKEVFGVIGLEGRVFGREVFVAHGADEAGRVEDDPQGPQYLPRPQRLLPALVAARVATLLLLKQIDAINKIGHKCEQRMNDLFTASRGKGQENKAKEEDHRSSS